MRVEKFVFYSKARKAPVRETLRRRIADKTSAQPQPPTILRLQFAQSAHRVLGKSDLHALRFHIEQINEAEVEAGEFFDWREHMRGARNFTALQPVPGNTLKSLTFGFERCANHTRLADTSDRLAGRCGTTCRRR